MGMDFCHGGAKVYLMFGQHLLKCQHVNSLALFCNSFVVKKNVPAGNE